MRQAAGRMARLLSERDRAPWCLWGAALAAAPDYAPLQLGGSALAATLAALLVLSLVGGLEGDSPARLRRHRRPLVAAGLALLVTLWALRCANPPYGSALRLMERAATTAAFLAWLVSGLALPPGGNAPECGAPDEEADQGARRNSLTATFVCSALVPAGLWAYAWSPWASRAGMLACFVASPVVVFLALAAVTGTSPTPRELGELGATSLAGQLVAFAAESFVPGTIAYLAKAIREGSLLLEGVWGSSLFLGTLLAAWALGLAAFVGHARRGSGTEQLPPDGRTADDPFESELARKGVNGRNREIALLLADGATVAEAARHMGVSAGAAGSYRSRAFARLGISTNDELRTRAFHTRAQNGPGNPAADTAPARKAWHLLAAAAILVMLAAHYFIIPDRMGRTASFLLALLGTARLMDVGLTPHAAVRDDVVEGRRLSVSPPLVEGLMIAVLPFFWTMWWMNGAWYDGALAMLVLGVGLLAIGAARHPETTRHGAARWLAGSLSRGCDVLLLGMSELPLLGACSFQLVTGTRRSWDLYSRAVEAVVVLVALAVVCAAGAAHERRPPVAAPLPARERAVHYLIGRGLGELEARVLVLTALGHTRGAICSELSVAPGTVNAYRSRGYRALGVSGAEGLRELLAREAGLHGDAE